VLIAADISETATMGGDMTGYDITWENDITSEWGNGAFLGNGLLGAMIYGDRDNPQDLQWELGRTDVCAHYQIEDIDWNMPRVFIGELVMKPASRVASRSMRLDIENGEASGTIITDGGRIEWRSFIPREENVTIIEMHTEDDEDAAKLTFRERWGVSPRIYAEGKTPEELPPEVLPPRPVRSSQGEVHTCVQPLTEKGAYATAYRTRTIDAHHRVLYCTVAQSHDKTVARDLDVQRSLDEAVAILQAACDMDLGRIESGHRDWWREYYALSNLSLPDDPKWERFFWLQMYKLGSAARSDVGVVMDQLGPWMTQVSWPATWWNINVQVAYYAAYAPNHLDIGRSLVTAMNRMYRIGSFKENTPQAYRHDSIYVGRSTNVDGIGNECDEGVNLLWALHNYWRQWRCSMDESLIDDALFPMLKESVNYLLHLVFEKDDGYLHLPPLYSPEYTGIPGERHEDIHYALSLLGWALQTLLNLDERFGKNDPKRDQWTDTLARLHPLPVDENGYMVAPAVPFAQGHRHHSHMLAMYPLHTLTPRDAASTLLFRRTLDHWVGLSTANGFDSGGWCGFSFSAASAMFAMLGEAEKSIEQMDGFLDALARNGMFLECDGKYPSLEAPLMAVEGLTYMLFQTWDDTIRVFPAVPARWQNVSFRDFRAEGAFLVSAVREKGRTLSVQVKSLAGEPLRVMPNLPCGDEEIAVEAVSPEPSQGGPRPLTVERLGAGGLRVDLQAGETATFRVRR